MNELQIFTYNNAQVRMVEKDGEPWFVLKDVCDVLGLTTPTRVAERLDEDEVSQTHLVDSIGRKQDMTVINESGLYSVILRSDKPEAKPFRKWVTSEVLPSIRKTGKYEVNSTVIRPQGTRSEKFNTVCLNSVQRALNSKFEDIRKDFLALQKDLSKFYGYFSRNSSETLDAIYHIEQLEKENDDLYELIANNQHKIDFYDTVCDTDNLYAFEMAAKLFSSNLFTIGRNTLRNWLIDNTYLHRKTQLPYQKWIDKGIFKVCLACYEDNGETISRLKTYITANGLQYLFAELKRSFIECELPIGSGNE